MILELETRDKLTLCGQDPKDSAQQILQNSFRKLTLAVAEEVGDDSEVTLALLRDFGTHIMGKSWVEAQIELFCDY